MKTGFARSATFSLLGLLVLCSSASAQLGRKIRDKNEADERVKTVFDEIGWKYQIDEDNDFRSVQSLDDDRSHVVFVNTRTSHIRNMEVREVWAPAYYSDDPLDADAANYLLEMNADYKVGSWSVQKLNDGRYIVIFRIVISAESDEIALIGSIRVVSEAADELEKEVLGTDDL